MQKKKETRTPPGLLLALIAQAMGHGRATRLGTNDAGVYLALKLS